MSKERDLLEGYLNAANKIPVKGIWSKRVTRANGDVEVETFSNIVTAAGLNALARRAIADTTSPFGFMSIGSETTPASLGSVEWGEMIRRSAYTITSSKSTLILVSSYAGFADSIASSTIYSGAVVNHVDSGQGVALSITNSAFTTLADSDFLVLTAEIQIGSHNL